MGAARVGGVQIITGCDVQDTASVAAMAQQVAAPVDILINNVGPALGVCVCVCVFKVCACCCCCVQWAH